MAAAARAATLPDADPPIVTTGASRTPADEPVAHRPLDRGEDRPRVGEAHLRLRGVHVHVHEVRGKLHEDERLEATVPRSRRPVRLHHRLRQRPVAHGAPIDEEPQAGTRRPRAVGTRDEAAHRGPVRAALDRHQILQQLRAEELEEPRRQAVHGRRLEHGAPAGAKREAGLGPRQRQKRHGLGHVRGLGRGRAQELAPGRQRPEEVAHLHGRPARVPHVAQVAAPAVGDLHLRARRLALGTRSQHELRHGRDRRQRLAAEAVGRDPLQVLELAQLRGGVPLERQLRVGAAHALPVVAHAHERRAAVLDLDVHASAPRRRARSRPAP